jgi:hypothetical protein
MGALQIYRDVLEPFTRSRKSTSAQRASILELWSDVVRRCVSKRFVFFDAPAADGGPPDILLAKSVKPSMVGGPHMRHDRLLVLVQFLRFATLRKVVDHVLEPSAPALLTISRRRHVLCSIMHAASELSSLLPTEDLRVGGVRRGIPWGSIGEGFSSSDEDRDDGSPRPIESLLATASALIVAHWQLVCPLHWSGAIPPDTVGDDDGLPSRWSSRTTSPTSAAAPADAVTSSASSPAHPHPTFQDMSSFAECIKMLLLRNLWLRQETTLGATLSMTLSLTRSLMLYNKSRGVATVPPNADQNTLSLFLSPEVKDMVSGLDFFRETFATKTDSDHLLTWAPRHRFSPGVRALHTSLIVRATRAGVYKHRLSSGSGFAKMSTHPPSASDHLELSMSVSSRSPRVSTLHVLMEVFEWYLANGGPVCATRYLHSFPSRHGEDTGHSGSATESKIIAVSTLLTDEARRRCVMVCEEFSERRNIKIELFTESTRGFPFSAAVIAKDIPVDGPNALRYDARKKIAEMLQSMCPDRYPIHETILLPDDVPEVEAIERERSREAMMETELLRVARLEVHERLEWERVAANGRDRLHVLWSDEVNTIFASSALRLADAEAAARLLLDCCAMEVWGRASLAQECENERSDVTGSAMIEKMRCKVREREKGDHHRVAGLVTILEVTSRAEQETAEAKAALRIVEAQEDAQRSFIAQHRLREVSYPLGLDWVATQAAVFRLRLCQREAAERNLMIRWMIASLSRSLQRQRPSTLRRLGHDVRVYTETFLNAMLSAHCETTNPDLTVGAVWDWYQARLSEAESFIKLEAAARASTHATVDSFYRSISMHAVPQLNLDGAAAEERNQRRMLHLEDCLGAVSLHEMSARLGIAVDEQRQFSCSTSTPTAAYDAIVLFESLCSRLRTIVDSTEPLRAASLAATERLCWERLMAECHKSRRELYKRQRPSEATHIGPERGLAPRPPTAQIRAQAPPPQALTDYDLSPEVHAMDIASHRAALKSPASTIGSCGAASTTPGLSATRDLLSALSISELDRASVTFLLDLGETVAGTRALSSQPEGDHAAHQSRQCYTPQPPATVTASTVSKRRRTMSSTTTTLLSSPSYRGVIDIPRRPTSAKPQPYKLASRTTVDPSSRSPLRYRADEDDSISLFHKIVANAQAKH